MTDMDRAFILELQQALLDHYDEAELRQATGDNAVFTVKRPKLPSRSFGVFFTAPGVATVHHRERVGVEPLKLKYGNAKDLALQLEISDPDHVDPDDGTDFRKFTGYND